MLESPLLSYLLLFMRPAQLDLEKLPASDGANLVTRLRGKLSLETVHNFIRTIRPEPAEHLVLDMSGVSFLDSAGVGALVMLFVHRRNIGKSFALAALTGQGTAVLQVTGLVKVLPNFPTVESALGAKN